MNEQSLESKQWGNGRGLFSYVLLKGLYGMADVDNDKTVTYQELKNYLETNITKLAKPNLQNPVVIFDNGAIPISTVNDNLLARYKKKENRSITFLSKIDAKGSSDWAFKQATVTQRTTFEECDSLINNGNLEAAHQSFQRYRHIDSTSDLFSQLRRNLSAALQEKASDIFEKANTNIDLANFNLPDAVKAERYIETAASILGEDHYLYPSLNARIMVLKALQFGRRGDTSGNLKAVDLLKRSIKIEPNASYSYFNLGVLYLFLDKNDSAESYLKQYIELVPNSWEANANLGEAYYFLKKYQQAEQYFLKAVEIKPDFVLGYSNLGGINIILKRYETARDMCNNALALDSTFVQAWRNGGQSEYYLKNYSGAIAYYNRAISLHPKDSTLFDDLATICRGAKKYDSVILFLEAAMKIVHNKTRYIAEMAQIYRFYLKDNVQAKERYLEVLALNPNFYQAHFDLGEMYAEENNIDSSLQHLEQWIQLTQQLPERSPFGNTRLTMLANSKAWDNIRTSLTFREVLERNFPTADLAKFPRLFEKRQNAAKEKSQ